ncbi:MAG: 4-hydroxy-tetrahydrodipicolinate synthase [bacterium]
MFSGSLVALVTPFESTSIDEKGLRRNVRFQIENGTSGLVPCGTTGESPTLDRKEWEKVVSITVEEAGGKVPVIAGTGTNSTRKTVDMTMRAKELGATAALVVTPYYNRPTQEGLYHHYRSLALDTGFPIVLYNVPGRTGVNLLPETVLRLSELEQVVAVKEASGNLTQAAQIARECAERIVLLSGDDALTLPLLSLGAKGVISVVANIVPRDVSDMIASFLSGEAEEARRIHERLLPLCRAMFLETNPIPVKAAMEFLDMPAGKPRLPLTEISQKNESLLKQALAEYCLMGREGRRT